MSKCVKTSFPITWLKIDNTVVPSSRVMYLYDTIANTVVPYRRVVYLHDVVQYDNLVNRYEIEAYQTLSMKLHLPLNHRLKQKPRRTLITTEMGT